MYSNTVVLCFPLMSKNISLPNLPQQDLVTQQMTRWWCKILLYILF